MSEEPPITPTGDAMERKNNMLSTSHGFRQEGVTMGESKSKSYLQLAKENPNLDVWGFEGLVNAREEIGGLGEDLSDDQKDVLEAVNAEINNRLKDAQENGQLDFLNQFGNLAQELQDLQQGGASEQEVEALQSKVMQEERDIWKGIEKEMRYPRYLKKENSEEDKNRSNNNDISENALRKFALKRYANEMHEQINNAFPDVEPMDSFEEMMGMQEPGTGIVRSPGDITKRKEPQRQPDAIHIDRGDAGGAGGGGGNETVSGISPEDKEPSEMSVAEVRREMNSLLEKQRYDSATPGDNERLRQLNSRREELLERARKENHNGYYDAIDGLEHFRGNFKVMDEHPGLDLQDVLNFKNDAHNLIREAKKADRSEPGELQGIREEVLKYGYVDSRGEQVAGFENGIFLNMDRLVQQTRENAERATSPEAVQGELLNVISQLAASIQGLEQRYAGGHGGMTVEDFVDAMESQNKKLAEAFAAFGERTPPFTERSRWVDMEYRQEFYTQFDPRSEPHFYKNMRNERERRVWDYRWRLARIAFYKKATNALPEKYKESQDVTLFTNEMINVMLERVEGTKEMMEGYVGEILDPNSDFWKEVRKGEEPNVEGMNTERFDAFRQEMREKNRDSVIVRMSDWNNIKNRLSDEAIAILKPDDPYDAKDDNIRNSEPLRMTNYQTARQGETMSRLDAEQAQMILRDFERTHQKTKQQFAEGVRSSDKDKIWGNLSAEAREKLDGQYDEADNPLGLTPEQRQDPEHLMESLTQEQIDLIYKDLDENGKDFEELELTRIQDNVSELTQQLKERQELVNGVSMDEWLDLKIKEADAVAWNAIYVSNLVEWADSSQTISGSRHSSLPLILASDDYRAVHHPWEKWISKSWSGHEGWSPLVAWSSHHLWRIAKETGRTEYNDETGEIKIKKGHENDFIYELASGEKEYWKPEDAGNGKIRIFVPAAFAPTAVDSFFHQSRVINKGKVRKKDETQLDGYARDDNGNIDEEDGWTINLNKFRTFRPDSGDTEAEHPFGLWVATRFDKALQFNQLARGGSELKTSVPIEFVNPTTVKWAMPIIELHNRLRLRKNQGLNEQQIMDMNYLIFIASTEGVKDPSKKVPESLTYIDSARKGGIKATLKARGLSVDFRTNIFS